VGYPADTAGNIISGAKSTMVLSPEPLPSQPTINSKIDLNLDTRNPPMDIRFDPTNSITYSQATSQTIYDQNGNGHILSLYYKRISSQPLNLTLGLDGAYGYNPTQQLEAPVSGTPAASFDAATKRPKNEQMSVIASTYKGEDKKYITTAGARVLDADNYDANDEDITIYSSNDEIILYRKFNSYTNDNIELYFETDIDSYNISSQISNIYKFEIKFSTFVSGKIKSFIQFNKSYVLLLVILVCNFT
jgi:flagellar hook protein FlgE